MFQKIINKYSKISNSSKYCLNFYLVWLLVSIIFSVFLAKVETGLIEEIWWIILFAPILVLIVFSPVIFISTIIFQYIKNYYVRIYILSILIPLNNFFYMLVFPNSFISYIIGALMLFMVLPILFIVTLLLPKKYFPYKQDLMLLSIITEIVGIFFSYMILVWIPNMYTYIELNRHDKTIDSLENYKIKNGVYPQKLSDIKVVTSGTYRCTEYKQLRNGQNYIYKVKESEGDFYPVYVYTPDQEYKKELLKNEQRKNSPTIYIDKGKWILEKIDD